MNEQSAPGNSLSRGWRQDVNTESLGYFRTDDETTRRIARLISVPDVADNLILYDPCCGEGIALSALQQKFGGSSFGIEYDAERFHSAAQCVDTVLHGNAIGDLYASSQWASLMLFNPPYGDTTIQTGGQQVATRLEGQFWQYHADRVVRGGLVIAILPDYLFNRLPQMARLFAHYFNGQPWGLWRAATSKFKQIVFIGHRTIDKNGFDPQIMDLLLAVAEGKADVPVLPENPDPLFPVPAGVPPAHFETFKITSEYISEVLARFDDEAMRQDITQALTANFERKRARSIMPLRDGHIPAVLASGLLDGYVADEGGRFLVKGMAHRVQIHMAGEVSDSEASAGVRSRQIYISKTITMCYAWNTETNELIKVD